jgi:uracil-DNA glycosylase family 4
LVAWREQVARTRRKAYADREYWGKPVPGFGDPAARVLVVGLAPGAHGSNRTGRQFTGDASGKFLFPALFRAGFASKPDALDRDDGLSLRDMYITAAARCAPPENKPSRAELENCLPYLAAEIGLIGPKVIVCLGRVAFEEVLRILRSGGSNHRQSLTFAHGAAFRWDRDLWLLCSYHPSQQNTSTGRLTMKMFEAIWAKARLLAARA